MRFTRLLTLGPVNEPLWICLDVQQIGEKWAAMIVADGVPPPESATLKGFAFFGMTPADAERRASAYLGCSEPVN